MERKIRTKLSGTTLSDSHSIICAYSSHQTFIHVSFTNSSTSNTDDNGTTVPMLRTNTQFAKFQRPATRTNVYVMFIRVNEMISSTYRSYVPISYEYVHTYTTHTVQSWYHFTQSLSPIHDAMLLICNRFASLYKSSTSIFIDRATKHLFQEKANLISKPVYHRYLLPTTAGGI